MLKPNKLRLVASQFLFMLCAVDQFYEIIVGKFDYLWIFRQHFANAESEQKASQLILLSHWLTQNSEILKLNFLLIGD